MNDMITDWLEKNAMTAAFLGVMLVLTSIFGGSAMFPYDSRVPALLFGGLLASIGGSILSLRTLERLLDSRNLDED